MLFFLIICVCFILFYKSLRLKPLPPWASEMRLLYFWFGKDFSFLSLSKSIRNILPCRFTLSCSTTSVNKKILTSKAEIVELGVGMSLLDLPELVLECILERLPPEGLCNMAAVCSSLRDRCTSDHLWEKHMKKKWGRIIGPAAYREWQWYIASNNDLGFLQQGKQRGVMDYVLNIWPLSLVGSSFNNNNNNIKRNDSPPVNSILSCYLALECGNFWFPAQVYNRENGHVGFMLSCYDAELSYDSRTDTFRARYPPHGRRAMAIESAVTWDRLRAPPIDTSPHDLHVSDCLNELRPGDHIEIQWRRNKEFPYGWWYGVVGHLDTCDGIEIFCRCHESDAVIMEFKQYTLGSLWRQTSISRRDHREQGNEADGFYGGVRKLEGKHEVSMWRSLWPTQVLE